MLFCPRSCPPAPTAIVLRWLPLALVPLVSRMWGRHHYRRLPPSPVVSLPESWLLFSHSAARSLLLSPSLLWVCLYGVGLLLELDPVLACPLSLSNSVSSSLVAYCLLTPASCLCVCVCFFLPAFRVPVPLMVAKLSKLLLMCSCPLAVLFLLPHRFSPAFWTNASERVVTMAPCCHRPVFA